MKGPLAIFKALSSAHRLKILQLLKGRSLCVKAITARLGVTQSAVSQHLRILKEAGLVRAEKHGYWMHYSLDEAALAGGREAICRILSVEEGPGRREDMCCGDKGKCCEHPERLKGGKPGDCGPEQIAKCHGDAKSHPCEGGKKKDHK